jgi:hypothetical protein
VNKVARLSSSDKNALFNETAARIGINPVIIEKDFWICWILRQLFTINEFEGWLVFKGGTSLSKCFNLIQRFSEDIDIAVDFKKLGFIDKKDPCQAGLSYTKRAALLDEMLSACQNYISGRFLTILTARIESILGKKSWHLRVSSDDPNTIEFEYPASTEIKLDYIRPHVVLELGTHAEPVPNEKYEILPFVAEHFPQLFIEPRCSIATVVARRTFWEKATILHAEYHRPSNKQMPLRYSRHYSDVAAMSQNKVTDEALADIDLLKSVINHKSIFYRSNWAQYEQAYPGGFHLIPRSERVSAIRRDYREMSAMFFNEPPEFESILEQLLSLEKRINLK